MKRASLKGAKVLLDIEERPEVEEVSKGGMSRAEKVALTVRLEKNFYDRLRRKLRREGRTFQGYVEYLIRRDMERI